METKIFFVHNKFNSAGTHITHTFPRQLDLRSGTTRVPLGQRLSTQQQLYQPEVFSPGEQNMPATLLSILLIMAGIEQNPGPDIWFCSVCHSRIMRNTTSVRCTVCNNWCHLKRCSGLTFHRNWSPSFIASCCSTQPPNISTTPTVITPQNRARTPPSEHNRARPHQWKCSVCQGIIRRNVTSVRCNGCNNWCHMRRCTNLRSHRDWNDRFLADCCVNNNNTITPTGTPVRTAQTPPTRSTVRTPSHTPQLQQQITPTTITPQLSNFTPPTPQQHPRRRHATDSHQSFQIMQLNCNGLRNNIVEITKFIYRTVGTVVKAMEN